MKRLVLVVAAVALWLPVTAFAATLEYRGKTAQGRKASGRVVDGRLKLFKVSWKVPCDHAGPWTDRTHWEDKPDGPIEHDGSKFTDGGEEEHKLRDGRIVYNLKLSGAISDTSLKGKMTVRMRLYTVEGEHVNNCRGTIRFNVPRA